MLCLVYFRDTHAFIRFTGYTLGTIMPLWPLSPLIGITFCHQGFILRSLGAILVPLGAISVQLRGIFAELGVILAHLDAFLVALGLTWLLL